jgi:hypothetical protein
MTYESNKGLSPVFAPCTASGMSGIERSARQLVRAGSAQQNEQTG